MVITSFIQSAINVHGDKYNYSKVEYKNAHTNVIIICSIHGEFLQRPDAHIHQKQGCPICGLENRKHPWQKTTDQFITQAKKKWNYDYSNTFYINKTTKIKYVCSKHGIIEQYPILHLRSGCPYCNGRGISRHSLVSFIEIANKIHENKYDYSKTKFLRMNDDVIIICPIHSDFEQRAGNHIHLENGCPQCARQLRTSKGEKEILNFFKEHYDKEILENNREILKSGREIDIFIPDLKLGIEYHGLYWHVETVRGRKFHYEKYKEAKDIGIYLLQIYSNEWEDKRAILESKFLNLIGKSKRIGARETKIVEIDKHSKDEFLTKNHLQGSDASKYWYGLIYNGELVSCMTFGESRFNCRFDYELMRFCNLSGLVVVGGAGKLLSVFRKDHSGSIVSYADKRYSNGNLYRRLGFTLDGESNPSFTYVKISNGQIYNRMKFQKQYLKDMPYYSDDLTEYEIMQLNGYDRIWDAGQFRFAINDSSVGL